jgi:hypothetical protein
MNAQIDFCLGNNPLICDYKRFQCIIDQSVEALNSVLQLTWRRIFPFYFPNTDE